MYVFPWRVTYSGVFYVFCYFVFQHGCKIGKGKFTGGQATFVFPDCIKKVAQAIVGENIKDYEDPVGSQVSFTACL